MPVFLEVEIVDNIFQLAVLKTMWQIKKVMMVCFRP